MEEIAKQSQCMEEKMQYNKSCKQAYLIRKNTGYPPDKIQKYDKNIIVFTVTTGADGQTIFYLIDNEGKFIELTQDEKLINTNQTYIQLKKKYPNLSFTSFVFWSKVFEDTFPKTYSSHTSGLQIIFRQELQDGPCVACKPVGIASVAYVFDDKGKFSGIKLLKIESLPKSFNR